MEAMTDDDLAAYQSAWKAERKANPISKCARCWPIIEFCNKWEEVWLKRAAESKPTWKFWRRWFWADKAERAAKTRAMICFMHANERHMVTEAEG